MIVEYETEADYLDAFENGTMTPMQFFLVRENNVVGLATSASERILFPSMDGVAQFSDVYVQGNLTVYGEISNP